MRRRSMTHRALIVVAAVVAVAAPAGAQQRFSDVERDCDVRALITVKPSAIPAEWRGLYPDSVATELVADVRVEAWGSAIATAIARGERAIALAPHDDARARYATRLASLDSHLR